MKKYGIIFLLMLSTLAFADSLITKVIPLTYISTHEAENAVGALLQPGESMSQANQQLIVNVSPETLQKMRVILHAIDIPPVMLGVFIHQDQANWLDSTDNDDITYSTHAQSNAANNQSVQVLSGASAFIAMDTNVPMVSSVDGGWDSGVSYERMNLRQGFLIQPQLQGAQIKLKIRRTNDKANSQINQEVDRQAIDTTTLIPLDRWVKLGSSGNADVSDNESSDITYGAGAGYQQKGTLFIKISRIKH